MAMPLRMFWSANKQIERIRAEKDVRSLQIALATNAPEGAVKLQEHLREEIASPAVVIKGFDEDKYLEMKRKMEAKDQ